MLRKRSFDHALSRQFACESQTSSNAKSNEAGRQGRNSGAGWKNRERTSKIKAGKRPLGKVPS